MSAGRLFAVVGPSGAGKDTLIDAALKARPDLVKARRVITRPEAQGGEDFERVSGEEFETRRAAGEFALHWQAHGLRYGIPKTIDGGLSAGRGVIFNGSRAVLLWAQALYPSLSVLLVTAPVPVLARRLAGRGRETREQIETRLTRADYDIPPGLPVQRINNDGPLDQAVEDFLAVLEKARGVTSL